MKENQNMLNLLRKQVKTGHFARLSLLHLVHKLNKGTEVDEYEVKKVCNTPAKQQLFDLLRAIDKEAFEEQYVETLTRFMDMCGLRTYQMKDKSRYDGFSLVEGRLINEILLSKGCHSVWQPKCRAGFLMRLLDPSIAFIGSDREPERWFFKILAEAIGRKNASFVACDHEEPRGLSDKARSQTFGKAESCVSDTTIIRGFVQDEQHWGIMYNNDCYWENSMTTAVIVVRTQDCWVDDNSIRRKRYASIVRNNWLDMVVSLPQSASGALKQAPHTVIVLNRQRKPDDPVCFIDWSQRTFDGQQPLLDGIDDDACTVMVSPSTLQQQEALVLYPAYYLLQQQHSPLHLALSRQLLHLAMPVAMPEGNTQCLYASHKCFNRQAAEVLVRRKEENLVSISDLKSSHLPIKVYRADQPLFVVEAATHAPKFYFYDGKHSSQADRLVVDANSQVFYFDADIRFSPDYIVLQLLDGHNIERAADGLPELVILQLDLHADQQKRAVSQAIQDYLQQQRSQLDAIASRNNFLSSRADLVHMLSTPLLKMQLITGMLKEPQLLDADRLQILTGKLDALVKRMRRMANNELLPPDEAVFNPTAVDISSFLTDYMAEWTHAGLGMNLLVAPLQNHLPDGTLVSIDPEQTRTMLDAIFENARRHGPDPERPDLQLTLQPTLDAVSYDGKPWVLLSAANNGRPLPPDMTVADYVSKGRFDKASGHTGLGGYHIYTIARKNGGHLHIGSTASDPWHFTVDVLLPLASDPALLTLRDYNSEIIL